MNAPKFLTFIVVALAGALSAESAAAATAVVAWGSNSYGQTNVPPGLTNIVAISANELHTVALRADGTVVSWGVGDNRTNVPPGLSNVVAVAAGGMHSVAVKRDGTVAAWSCCGSLWGLTNVPSGLTNVVRVSCGHSCVLALKGDGSVVSWGDPDYTNLPPDLAPVTAIAAGDYHNLAIKPDGTVVAWGDNTFNQTNVPTGLSNVIAVAAGQGHSLALRRDGTVVGWGFNNSQQATPPNGLSNVVAIAAGGIHSMALKSDGTLVPWGDPFSGQNNIPSGATNVSLVADGSDFSVAVTGRLPPGTNADLAALVLSAGTLTPAFDPAVINYTASVIHSVTNLAVTVTSADTNAMLQVRVNGGAFSNVFSGLTSPPLPLNIGTNLVDVKVTAQNLITTKTYGLAVTRMTNRPPVVDAGGDRSLYARDSITLDALLTEPDGDGVQWCQWQVIDAPAGASWTMQDATAAGQVPGKAVTFQPQTPGLYHLSLTASDGFDTSAPDIITITAHGDLRPMPVVSSLTITNPTGATNEMFGFVVAGSQNGLMVGAPHASASATNVGAAYLFSTNGTLLTAFTNPAPVTNGWFGSGGAWSVWGSVLVGAPGANAGGVNAGAVYEFLSSGALWQTYANPAAAADDNFGAAVGSVGPFYAVEVVVGAPQDNTGATDGGSAYVSDWTNTGTNTLRRLAQPTPAAEDHFGNAVATVGAANVLIGAYRRDTSAPDAGAAYLYWHSIDTGFKLVTTYTNPAPVIAKWFGYSVAGVGEDRVLIGTPGDDTGMNFAGATYLFDLSGNLLATYTNPSPATCNHFGSAVAGVGRDRVVIGAYRQGSTNNGAAFLFDLQGNLLTTFTNPAPCSGDGFGCSVTALSPKNVVVGASGSGHAYLFTLTNRPPLANAGPDRVSIVSGIPLQLGGSASDPDGDTIILRWSMEAAPGGYLLNTNTGNFTGNVPGDYLIRLTVTDGIDQEVDFVTVHVIAANQDRPPVANAGPDMNVYQFERAVLQGSASDPDGDPIYSWFWEVVEMPTGAGYRLLDADTPDALFFTEGWLGTGDFVLSLTVGDGISFGAGVDYVTIHVRSNLPPVAIATADKTNGPAPLTVCFDGSQSHDPEGAPLSYFWEFGDGSDYATNATVCHSFVQPGRYEVTFLVEDERAAIDMESFTITVPTPPVAVATANPVSGPSIMPVHFDGSQSHGDTGRTIVSYVWNFGDGTTNSNISPTHQFAAGLHTVNLTVTDDLGGIGTNSVQVLVGHGGNWPPVAEAGTNRWVATNAVTILNGSATDHDSQPIVGCSWTVIPPATNAQFSLANPADPQSAFSAQTPGTYVLSLSASDGIDWSLPDTVTVWVGIELPPVAEAGPDTNSCIDVPIVLQGSGSDPDGDPIILWSWEVEQSPAADSWNLVGADTPTPIFTGHALGDYVLSLVVWDGMSFNVGIDYVTVHVAPPRLLVALTSTNTVLLAWPAALTNYDLQQNADLTTTKWLPVTDPPVVIGSEKQVLVPPASARNFYRLHKP